MNSLTIEKYQLPYNIKFSPDTIANTLLITHYPQTGNLKIALLDITGQVDCQLTTNFAETLEANCYYLNSDNLWAKLATDDLEHCQIIKKTILSHAGKNQQSYPVYQINFAKLKKARL